MSPNGRSVTIKLFHLNLHWICWLLLSAAALGSNRMSSAGECIEFYELYVDRLEAGPVERGFWESVHCLTSIDVGETHRWAGPVAAQAFEQARADTLRPRIARAIDALIGSAWADLGDNRRDLGRLAARYGIGRADSVDVYLLLIASVERFYFADYVLLAILRDARIRAFLQDRFLAIRSEKAHPTYIDEPADILCCLYHIPGEESVALARKMLLAETDAMLKERLQRIIDRPS